MPLIALSLIALHDNSLTTPILTEALPQTTKEIYEISNYTPEASKNDDFEEHPKFLELIYNKETSWGKTTAKQRRTKKHEANECNDIITDKIVSFIDQLLVDKANGTQHDTERSFSKSDNLDVATTNISLNRDKTVPFGSIFANAVRNNEQDCIFESKEQQNDTTRHEFASIDVVDGNKRYQNANQAKTFANRTIKVVNIERLQKQTIQFQNSVSIPSFNPSNTRSVALEDVFLQDIEMTDLDSINPSNTQNLIPVINNTVQDNSAVDSDRYCLGCKRKLALESNVETPSAKRPRLVETQSAKIPMIKEAVPSNTSRVETPGPNNKPTSASAIPTIVSRNVSPDTNNSQVPVANTSSDSSNKNSHNKCPNDKNLNVRNFNPDLNVEITTANRRKLSFPKTLFIKEELTTMILNYTNNNSDNSPEIFVPRFIGKPVQAKGVLKLWCADISTLIWLKNAIHVLPIPRLAIKRQCDKFIRIQFIKAGIFLPCIYYEKYKIIEVLKFMNPWARVETWPIDGAKKRGDYVLFTVGIPFEIVGEILGRDRVMQFVMGTVRVRFFKGKELIDIPHDLTNGPGARALHTQGWQRFPARNWGHALPPHQFHF